MVNYHVCSFYTKNTPYEKEVELFKKQIEQFKIPYTIIPVESRGSWVRNVNIKPEVCLSLFKTINDPILYTDIDSRIQQFPKYLEDFSSYDIVVHYRKGKELLSGTIILNHTEATLNIIQNWIQECSLYPDRWDQKNLDAILKRNSQYKIGNLPSTYVQIFDLMRNEGVPIIEHFQASRKYKRLIK